MHSRQQTAVAPAAVLQLGIVGLRFVIGATPDSAVVMIVNVVVAVPFAAMLIVVGLKLQLDSDGNPEQSADVSVMLPLLLNPFSAVNVSTVDPDCPGAMTGIVVGFAATVNVGVGVTVWEIIPLDVA
jgi:hypothetical protein